MSSFNDSFPEIKQKFNRSWFKTLLYFTDIGRMLSDNNSTNPTTFIETYLSSYWWNRLLFRLFMKTNQHEFTSLLQILEILKKNNLLIQVNLNNLLNNLLNRNDLPTLFELVSFSQALSWLNVDLLNSIFSIYSRDLIKHHRMIVFVKSHLNLITIIDFNTNIRPIFYSDLMNRIIILEERIIRRLNLDILNNEDQNRNILLFTVIYHLHNMNLLTDSNKIRVAAITNSENLRSLIQILNTR